MIVILLATYQGEKYLPELLSSIQRQTEPNWLLIVRDDGSTDQTITLLQAAAEQDSRILLCEDSLGNLGVSQNFARLLKVALHYHPTAVFFADQDDVWLPEKIARQCGHLEQAEQRFGSETPLLVHSDAKVVDAQLNEVHSSFQQYSRLQKAKRTPLKTLLAHNYVTGCTTAINTALLRRCQSIPIDAFMHDWWIALVAASVGEIVFDTEPTLLYRQHEQNVIGARKVSYFRIARDLLIGKRDWEQDRQLFQQTISQAQALRNWLGEQPYQVPSQSLVDSYCEALCNTPSAWRRLWKLSRSGMPGLTLPRRLLYYYRLLRSDLGSSTDAEVNSVTIPFPAPQETRHVWEEQHAA